MSIVMAEKTSFLAMVHLVDRVYSRHTSDLCLEKVGLNRLVLASNPGFLPISLQAVFLEAAARITGDESLGQRLGCRYEYSSLGWYSKYVLAAPNLLQAVVRGKCALPFINPGCEVSYRNEDERIVLTYNFNIPTVNGIRRMEEAMPGLMVSLVRCFAGQDWHPDWVEQPGPKQKSANALEEVYRAPVHYGAATVGIALKKEDLFLKNRQPARPDANIFMPELPGLIGVLPPKTVRDCVITLFPTQLQIGDTSVEAFAERLSVGTRTLERQLQMEGDTFRDLKQRFLHEKSLALLRSGEFSVAEVTRALGYSEPNSFRRAFKKWTGVSPTRYTNEDK